MALRTAVKDGQGNPVDRARLYVCFESFSSAEPAGRCAAGTRLLGSHPTVQGWPQFFVDGDTPDDQIFKLRADQWAAVGAGAPT